MTDPTPTPAAPDSLRAALERLLKLRDNDTHALLGLDWHEAFEAARDALHAAALATTPPAPPLEPRGCPTPGACSCPTTPIVPQELIRALELAEAALERNGAPQELPRIRHALQAWREHATPPAPTREAAPVPRQGAEISDEELAEMAFAAGMEGIEVVDDKGWERLLLQAWEYELIAFARVVWARAQALPAADQQKGRDDA